MALLVVEAVSRGTRRVPFEVGKAQIKEASFESLQGFLSQLRSLSEGTDEDTQIAASVTMLHVEDEICSRLQRPTEDTCPTCHRPQPGDKGECDGCMKKADRT